MVDLPPDNSNPLLISAVLSQPIRKIALMFGIGRLSVPSNPWALSIVGITRMST
jgi:hypothetical protein